MIIREALGTSTPTSMTVVDTSTSDSWAAKADITASFSLGFIFPWTKDTRKSGRAWVWSVRAYSVTALRSSGRSPFSVTMGQTT